MGADSNNLDFDIIIVGSGIVGSTVACALGANHESAAGSELSIALIDRFPFDGNNLAADKQPVSFDARVSAITVASEKLFRKIGVWDQIEQKRSSPYLQMHVWEQDGTGSIHFSCDDINQPVLGHIIENSVIVNALMQHINGCSNIDVLCPAVVTALQMDNSDRPVELLLEDGRRLRASLLIAADGANSKIRELAHFSVKEWDYEQHAIVATVRTELPHHQTAIQRFMDNGPLAFLPLEGEDQHYCSIVWSTSPEQAVELMEMKEEDFSLALGRGIESRLGKIVKVENRASFPLRQRHATDYVQEGIVLVGDAAHRIHPLAGQGVNLGLLDAIALVDVISDARSKRISFADLRVLRRYQRKRIGHNLGMMWLMEGFKRLFADQPLGLRWLRNFGMSGIDKLAVVKNEIMRKAMGIE